MKGKDKDVLTDFIAGYIQKAANGQYTDFLWGCQLWYYYQQQSPLSAIPRYCVRGAAAIGQPLGFISISTDFEQVCFFVSCRLY